MGTLAELKARIAREIDRDDMDVNIAAAISNSIEHYASLRFWFTEATNTAVTTAGSEVVALSPLGSRVVDTVSATVGSYRYPLIARPLPQIDAWLGAGGARGQPTDYCVYGTSLLLYPTPNAVYTLTVRGIFDVLPALDDDSAANAWTTQGADLIAARSRLVLYRDVLLDTEAEGLANFAKGEAKKALIGETTRRLSTGRVRASW